MRRQFVRGTSRNPTVYNKLILNELENSNILATDSEGIVKNNVATSASLRNPFDIRTGTPIIHVSDSSSTGDMVSGNIHLTQQPVEWFLPYQYTVPTDKVLVVTKSSSGLACFDTSGWGGPPSQTWLPPNGGGHWGRISRVDSMIAVIDSGRTLIFDPSGYHATSHEALYNISMTGKGQAQGSGMERLAFTGMLYDKLKNPEVTPITCTHNYYDVPDGKTLFITSSGGDASGYVTGKRQWRLPDISGEMFSIDDTNNSIAGTYGSGSNAALPFSGRIPNGTYSLWGDIYKGPFVGNGGPNGNDRHPGDPFSYVNNGLIGEINKIITSCLPVPPTPPDGPITATFYTSPYPGFTTPVMPYHLRPLSNGLSTQQGTPHPKWWKNKTGQVVLANEPIGSGLTSGAGNVIFTGNSTSNSLLYFLGYNIDAGDITLVDGQIAPTPGSWGDSLASSAQTFSYISDPSGLFWSPSYVIRRPCGGLNKRQNFGPFYTIPGYQRYRDRESRDHPGQTVVDQNVRVEFGGVGYHNNGFSGYVLSNKYMNQVGLNYSHPQQVSVYYQPT
ncbi:MAG: hypothetical protein CMM25_08240 [Rhodospirillaceae bacterium]|nr:hypothetical protein [Rhodospirillaceae bacterium]